MRRSVTAFILSLLMVACGEAPLKEYGVQVVAEYPHDVESYTQGLFFQDGQLYESTGLKGKSTFRKVELETGKSLFSSPSFAPPDISTIFSPVLV